MENEIAAKKLAELGHITRLSIFRYLVKVGDEVKVKIIRVDAKERKIGLSLRRA